jgi:hypothetical protein
MASLSTHGKMLDHASKMLALPYFFPLAQVSRNVTVRFQICLSGVESGSSAK